MTLRYSRQKIADALQLLAEFEATSFPHADSNDAVRTLKSLLQVTSAQFNPTAASSLAVQDEMESTSLISEILELLGVISNSANVRNSFEIHGPVLDLISRLLDDASTKLIISFEWNYIPYTFPQNHPHLPSFVVIGLPASEASNALVLPVIGHEVGHSLWRRGNFAQHFEPEVNKHIIHAIKGKLRSQYELVYASDSILADQADDYNNLWTWSRAAEDALRQVEELFSDFTGLYLFGASYLDSFEYLLSPNLSAERDPEYPEAARRAQSLENNASKIHVPVDGAFLSSFSPEVSPFHRHSDSQLQLDLADVASTALAAYIADKVFEACAARNIATPSSAETARILDNFLLGVPAERTSGLGAILNAGWAAFKAPHFMSGSLDMARMSAINELVLKSVEVFEIERVTGHGVKKKHT